MIRKPKFRLSAVLLPVAMSAGVMLAPEPVRAQTSAASSLGAGANINITPKRVTLDRNRRAGTIFVYNQGDAAATFDIALIDRVMLGNGQIVELDEAASKPDLKPIADRLRSARDLVLISPRRVSLAPRQGQTIRLRASTLPDSGEYRTHMTIATLPERTEGTTAEQAASATPGQLQVRITAQYGVSVPVFVRGDNMDVRAAIENPRIDYQDLRAVPGGPLQRTAVASFDLVRLGANSLFGNIDIRLSNQKKDDPSAGAARSLGVYAELERRRVSLPLRIIPSPGERIEITFTDDDLTPGKVLAKSAF